MTNRLPIYLFSAVIALMAAVSSCDSDPIDYGDEYKTQNVAITSFRLLKNEKVLTNIDSVFFSIDLDNRRIFNADSLPKGTRIDKLPVVIGTSSVSRVDLIVPLAQGGDTTINYLTNPKDSIDFSHGPVTVRVTSNDGMVVADYQLKVNVHEMEPDSLSWGTMAVRTLPSAFDNPVAQKTAKLGDEAAVLTTDASGNASIAFSADPGADAWSIVRTTLPAGADIKTFVAAGDGLFIIAGGHLYRSADKGAQWSDTGVAMTWAYGAYDGRLIGCNASGPAPMSATYPASTPVVLPSDIPVSGTSQAVEFTSKWSDTPMIVMVGGLRADGTPTGSSWAYSGGEWACFSADAYPAGVDITLFPYYTFVTDNIWNVRKYPTLFAVGGELVKYHDVLMTYTSVDRGLTWSLAGSLLNMPEWMPSFSGAQALVFDTKMTEAGAKERLAPAWTEMPAPRLMPWFEVEKSVSGSRAVTAVTEWDCPYVYIFGGVGVDGKLSNTVYRGAINRLRFKPLY